MTEPKEAELLSYAVTILKQSGLVWWRMPIGGVRHQIGTKVIFKSSPVKGFPDLAGMFPLSGRLFALEIKTTKGKVSPEQVDWIAKINKSGGMAVVLRSKAEIHQFVTAVMKRHENETPRKIRGPLITFNISGGCGFMIPCENEHAKTPRHR